MAYFVAFAITASYINVIIPANRSCTEYKPISLERENTRRTEKELCNRESKTFIYGMWARRTFQVCLHASLPIINATHFLSKYTGRQQISSNMSQKLVQMRWGSNENRVVHQRFKRPPKALKAFHLSLTECTSDNKGTDKLKMLYECWRLNRGHNKIQRFTA